MDNQQNQSGNPTSGNDFRNPNTGSTTGSTGQSGETSGTGASRKTGAAGGQARGAAGTPGSQPSGQQNRDQNTDQPSGNVLDTAVESGKKWIEDSGVLNSVSQLPQSVKDWGSRAATRVGDLSTTQKIVGGALLAVGLGYLAARKGKSAKANGYGRQRSGSYGSSYGRSPGYQSPDAATSRRTSVGSSRTDSGSAYGNSGGTAGGNFSTGGSGSTGSSGAGFGSSSAGAGDYGSRTSESSYRSKNDDSRNIE